MSNHLPVLIVGAGPTGLMMACELERRDISFRIIDKNSGPTQGSNATWIQTRALEMFDAQGLADEFLRIGYRCDAINLYEGEKNLIHLPLKYLDSCYPFILMLPQRETEELLNQYLQKARIRVERPVELINVRQQNATVVATVKRPDGDTEVITSHWLVACDGASSTVREKCQIYFPGGDVSEQFVVADAQMSSFLPNNEVHVFFDKGTIFPDKSTVFAVFPWGSNKYRINANLYLDRPRQMFTEHEVREIIAERAYGAFVAEQVSWISPFWIHSKVVQQMRHGSIFFVGDAAHIHSPAGGQGMNTGLQDAYNLAWKLALVIRGKTSPLLLDSYQQERHPVNANIVNQTEYFTKMLLFDKTFFTKLHRFERKLLRNPEPLTKRVSMELTQLAIRYQHSPIIDYQQGVHKQAPQSGERMPDIMINAVRLYHYLQGTEHYVWLFLGIQPSSRMLAKAKRMQKTLHQVFPQLVKTYLVSGRVISDIADVIFDVDGVLHRRFCVKKSAVYVVRPDTYIGYCSRKIDINAVQVFLQEYLSGVLRNTG